MKQEKVDEINLRLKLYVERVVNFDNTISYCVKNLKNGSIILHFNDRSELDDFIKLLKEVR